MISSLSSPRLTLVLLASALRLVAAQQCYYPDGTAAIDVPCNSSAPASACCTSYGFCLSNGLCLDNGILSRGSCTDKNWDNPACAQYCKNDNPSGGQYVMACSNETFTCGFFPDNCRVNSSLFSISNAGNLILRSSQLTSVMEAGGIDRSLVQQANNTNTNANTTASANATTALLLSDDNYTAGAMAGVGVGVGVPLLIACVFLAYMVMREKRKYRAVNDALASMRAQMNQPTSSWSTWTGTTAAPKRASGPGAAELPSNVLQELESPVATRDNADNKPYENDMAKTGAF